MSEEISHSEAVERLGDALGWDDWTRARTSGDPRDAVDEAEAEIARRGLQAQYVAELWLLLELGSSTAPGNLFPLLTAPPDVRVRAMLRVLE